jgi:hypothetical protein
LKNFANSNKGQQLNFLLHHEFTNHKLVTNVYDLTFTQIYFQSICAKKHQEMIDKELSKSDTASEQTPLTIVDSDSPEEMREKFELMRGIYGNKS